MRFLFVVVNWRFSRYVTNFKCPELPWFSDSIFKQSRNFETIYIGVKRIKVYNFTFQCNNILEKLTWVTSAELQTYSLNLPLWLNSLDMEATIWSLPRLHQILGLIIITWVWWATKTLNLNSQNTWWVRLIPKKSLQQPSSTLRHRIHIYPR